MTFYAHSGRNPDRSDWQRLDEHALNVARLAADFAVPMGLERAAYLAGLLHDLGKYTPAFQARLAGASQPVDHSTAGAAHVIDLAAKSSTEKSSTDWLMAQLVAYGILGHHAGLPDRLGDRGFEGRIERFRGDPQRAVDPIWLDELKPDSANLLQSGFKISSEHGKFQLAFMARMMFSCLVDADFKDTEHFYSRLEGLQKDRKWPDLAGLLPTLQDKFNAYVQGLGDRTNDINRLRAEILAHVRSRAVETPGPFTLTVPTAGWHRNHLRAPSAQKELASR